MTWRGYFAIEDLGLDVPQRTVLIDALQELGVVQHPQPAYLCHWRTRLDGRAVIFEARFARDVLTVASVKNRLATIFGVEPESIDHDLQIQTYITCPTLTVTFSREGVDYLRMALFGGMEAGWSESGIECRGYLAENRDDWDL